MTDEELLVGLSHEERLRARRVKEAVAFLGGMVSKHGLYRLAEADAIPHEKANGIPRAGASRSSSRLYFTFQDLARWRAAHYRPESAPRLERVAGAPIQKKVNEKPALKTPAKGENLAKRNSIPPVAAGQAAS